MKTLCLTFPDRKTTGVTTLILPYLGFDLRSRVNDDGETFSVYATPTSANEQDVEAARRLTEALGGDDAGWVAWLDESADLADVDGSL